MAYDAPYTWSTGEIIKIGDRMFVVFTHGNGREHVVLQDESGQLVKMPSADAARVREFASPEEMSRFSVVFERSLHVRKRALRAVAILDGWAAMLPARIVNEDLSDYIEDIHRRCARGQRFRVWMRVASGMFWTGLNTFEYAMKRLGKKQAR